MLLRKFKAENAVKNFKTHSQVFCAHSNIEQLNLITWNLHKKSLQTVQQLYKC